jgi:HAD superfamily hydrolase (TIGR01509 family)
MNELLAGFDAGYAGFVYDCDGTVADTMGIHNLAWQEEFLTHGIEVPVTMLDELAGVPCEPTVEILAKRFGASLDVSAVALSKESRFYRNLDHVRAVPVVREHIMLNKGRAKLAIASGGGRDSVTRTLKTIGLYDVFDAIVCAEDYENGKPAPDPFREAARRLGLDPAQCLAFEDANAGVKSALAAGMSCVFVECNRLTKIFHP